MRGQIKTSKQSKGLKSFFLKNKINDISIVSLSQPYFMRLNIISFFKYLFVAQSTIQMTDLSKNPFFYLRRTNGKAFKIYYDIASIDYQILLERMHCIGEKQFKIDKLNQILFLRGCPLNQDNLAQMILQINISGKPENNIVHLVDSFKVLQQKISFSLVQANLNKKDQMTYSAHDKVRKLIVDVLEGDQEYIEQFFVIYAGIILDPQKTFRQQYVENLSNLYFMDSNIHLKDKDLMKERFSTYSIASNKDLKQSIFSFASSIRKSNATHQIKKHQLKEFKKDSITSLQNIVNKEKSRQIKDKNQLYQVTTAEKICPQSKSKLIQDIATSNLEKSSMTTYLSSQQTLQKKIGFQVDNKADSLSATYSPNISQQGQTQKKKEQRLQNIVSNVQEINIKQYQDNKKDVDINIWRTNSGDTNNNFFDKQITGKQIKQILNAKRKNLNAKPDLSILPDEVYNKFALNVNQALSLGKTGNSFACQSQIVSYYQGEPEQIIDQSSIEEEKIIGQPQLQYQYQPFTMIEDLTQQPINLETVNKSIRKRNGQNIVQVQLDKISQQSSQSQTSLIRSAKQNLRSSGEFKLSKKIDQHQKETKIEKQPNRQFFKSQMQKDINRGDRKEIRQLPISEFEKTSNYKQTSISKNSQKKLVKRQPVLKNEQDLAQLEQLQKKGNNFIMTNIQSTVSLAVERKPDFDKRLEQVLQKTSMSVNLNQNTVDRKLKVKQKKIINLQSILQNKSQYSDNQSLQQQVITQKAEVKLSKLDRIEEQVPKQRKPKDEIKVQIRQASRDQKPPTLLLSQYQQQLIKSWDKSINIMQGQSIMLEDSSDQEAIRQTATFRQVPILRKEESIIIWKGDGNISERGNKSSSDQSSQEDYLADFALNKINKQKMKSSPDHWNLDTQLLNVKEKTADRELSKSDFPKNIMTFQNKSIEITQGQSIMLPGSDQEQQQQKGVIGNTIKLSNQKSFTVWKGYHETHQDRQSSSEEQKNVNQQYIVQGINAKEPQGSQGGHSQGLKDISIQKQNNKIKNSASQSENSQESAKSIILWRSDKQKVKQANLIKTKVSQ